MAESCKTAYWAVIPAPVRYDPELRPNGKLLYAEISALCDRTGYCWASNDYLAALFGVGPKTVSELVHQLERRGYVSVEILRNDKGQILQRRIRLRDVPGDDPFPKNREWGKPFPKNRDTYPEKSGKERIEEEREDPPIVPPGGPKRRKAAADHLPERFFELWAVYPRHESKQAALRAWNKLKPSEELYDVIVKALREQCASKDWKRGIGIPYMATYLNQRRWEDVAPALAPAAAPSSEEGEEEIPTVWTE